MGKLRSSSGTRGQRERIGNGDGAVLAATITWHTYGRRPTKENAPAGLTSSLYSSHVNGTPFFHLGVRLPIPFGQPYAFESLRSTRTRSTHLVRTERFLEAWLHRELSRES